MCLFCLLLGELQRNVFKSNIIPSCSHNHFIGAGVETYIYDNETSKVFQLRAPFPALSCVLCGEIIELHFGAVLFAEHLNRI